MTQPTGMRVKHENKEDNSLRFTPCIFSVKLFLSISRCLIFSCWICLPYFLRSRCFLAASDFLMPCLRESALVVPTFAQQTLPRADGLAGTGRTYDSSTSFVLILSMCSSDLTISA